MHGGNQTQSTNKRGFTKHQTNLQFIKQLHEETKQEGQTKYDDAYPWDLDDRLNDTSY